MATRSTRSPSMRRSRSLPVKPPSSSAPLRGSGTRFSAPKSGDPMSVVNGQFTRTNSFGPGADRNYPRFFVESVQDQLASVQAGRPIFRDEERVEIIMPGNPYTRPVQRVTDEHRERWAKEYAAFKAGQELAPEGTPLEEWPRLKRSQVFELKALGFQTVEQVAKMDDHAIQKVGMGARQLCELAKAFLDDAAHAAEVERLAGDNARKDAELESLHLQVSELGKTISSMHAELLALRGAAAAAAAAGSAVQDPIAPNLAPAGNANTISSLAGLTRQSHRSRKTDRAPSRSQEASEA